MAIKRGLKPRLAEVGKIKIGGKGDVRKKTGGNGTYQLPIRYEHFVITSTEKDLKTGNFVPDKDLMDKLGGEPKEIPIVFLFDDIDMNFNTSFAMYQGAKCVCRGDGEFAERLFLQAGKPDPFQIADDGPQKVQKDERRKIVCDPENCPMMKPDSKGQTRCKPSGILSCLIPVSMNIGGVYRFRTHSWNTISNILASLDLIKTITGGVLVGLPMKLQFLKKSTEDHGNVNVVNVSFDGQTQQEMRQLAFQEMKNREDHKINILQIEQHARDTGFLKETDDPADIEAEFYNTDEEPEKEKEPVKNIQDRGAAVLGNVESKQPEEVIPEPEECPEVEGEPEPPEQVVEDVPEEEPSGRVQIGKKLEKNPFQTSGPAPEDFQETENPEPEEDSGQLDIF